MKFHPSKKNISTKLKSRKEKRFFKNHLLLNNWINFQNHIDDCLIETHESRVFWGPKSLLQVSNGKFQDKKSRNFQVHIISAGLKWGPKLKVQTHNLWGCWDQIPIHLSLSILLFINKKKKIYMLKWEQFQGSSPPTSWKFNPHLPHDCLHMESNPEQVFL